MAIIDSFGERGQRPDDWLRLTCINAFLMGNMLTDDPLPEGPGVHQRQLQQ